ncbi:hypothetical protein WN943_018327 [Citrus x changshan-huyou]
MLKSARPLTDQILSPTFKLSTVTRTTGVGITLPSLTRPAFTKNGSETPPLSHVSIYLSSPLFRVIAAPHGTLTATLWANVGSRVSRNGSEKSATTVIMWDHVSAFWGIGIGSVYDSGRYITLAEEKQFQDSTSVYKINATHEFETPKILESKFSRIKQTRPCQILAMARLTIFATNSIQACSENLFLVIMRSYLGKSTKITLNGFNSLKALLISLLGVGLHKHYDNGGSEKLSEKLCKIFRRLVAERMCIW